MLEKIITELGAEVIITTPEEHDKAVALISQMPLIVAQALCKNIKDNKLAQALASSGFKDTTRLALSNVEMACDMWSINKGNIIEALNGVKVALNELLAGDYENQARSIKDFRKDLYD